MAVLLTTREMFSHIEVETTIFAHCILIVDPLVEEPLQY